MRIVAFDPPMKRNLGWCVFEVVENKVEGHAISDCQAGTYTAPLFDQLWQSLNPIYNFVDEFLIEHNPDVVVIEKTNVFSGGFVTGQVSYAIGVILLACARNNVDVDFIYPTHCKKVVTGSGKATKGAIKKSVRSYFDKFEQEVNYDSEHAYDAVALILCWLLDNKLITKEE